MNKKKLKEIYYRLKTVTVLSDFTVSDVGIQLTDLLGTAIFNDWWEEDDDSSVLLEEYSDFARLVYENGGDLGLLMRDFIRNGDNLYLEKLILGEVTEEMEAALEEDLKTLQMASGIKSEDIIKCFEPHLVKLSGIKFPEWKNTPVRLKQEFTNLVKNIGTSGYGIFRESIMFKIDDDVLVPVISPDFQSLEELHGYERERDIVLRNTEAFVMGYPASNTLLYGDAGTGKSTTVKACAAHFADQGLRLIEFGKNQVGLIPEIAQDLAYSPLKFIFFIDDLTFKDNDDEYYALKGILEGNVRGKGQNVLVYATSNRRHLIKESLSDRQGDEVHLNDTLQENMSLSARFGLTVTFSKPDKDAYLSLVEFLAKENGMLDGKKLGSEEYNSGIKEIFDRAEAFAIRVNGRSPRTAKQFITLAKNRLG